MRVLPEPVWRHEGDVHRASRACKHLEVWQERFPRENQEITLTLGEVRHRADVLTETTVAEFQRSAFTPEQFNERNTFYQDLGYKVVWLYDLRDAFREGALREEPHKDAGLRFSWGNPR